VYATPSLVYAVPTARSSYVYEAMAPTGLGTNAADILVDISFSIANYSAPITGQLWQRLGYNSSLMVFILSNKTLIIVASDSSSEVNLVQGRLQLKIVPSVFPQISGNISFYGLMFALSSLSTTGNPANYPLDSYSLYMELDLQNVNVSFGNSSTANSYQGWQYTENSVTVHNPTYSETITYFSLVYTRIPTLESLLAIVGFAVGIFGTVFGIVGTYAGIRTGRSYDKRLQDLEKLLKESIRKKGKLATEKKKQ
jgi:uncharacterized membrane protein